MFKILGILEIISTVIFSLITSFPTLGGSGMKDDLFKKKVICTFESCKSIEAKYGTLNLKGKEFFSMLKQSTLGTKEISKSQTSIGKKNFTNGKDLAMLFVKVDILLLLSEV